MTKGSCVCGDFTFTYTGEPGGVAICHCNYCRKISGARGATYLIIPLSAYQSKRSSGKEAMTHTRKGSSGKEVTYHNCSVCGTMMWIYSVNMPRVRIVQMGTLDDEEVLQTAKPGVEVWTCERVGWVGEFEDAAQMEKALH